MSLALTTVHSNPKARPILTAIGIGLVTRLPIRLAVRHFPEVSLSLIRQMAVAVKLAQRAMETGLVPGSIFLIKMASSSAVLRMITVLQSPMALIGR